MRAYRYHVMTIFCYKVSDSNIKKRERVKLVIVQAFD